MIPKVEACLDSLEAGVRKTHIIDGRLRHSLLLEMYTDTGIGTEIVWKDADRRPEPAPAPCRFANVRHVAASPFIDQHRRTHAAVPDTTNWTRRSTLGTRRRIRVPPRRSPSSTGT